MGNTASFEEWLQRWRAVGNTVSDLAGPRFEPQTSRSRSERATARLTLQSCPCFIRKRIEKPPFQWFVQSSISNGRQRGDGVLFASGVEMALFSPGFCDAAFSLPYAFIHRKEQSNFNQSACKLPTILTQQAKISSHLTVSVGRASHINPKSACNLKPAQTCH